MKVLQTRGSHQECIINKQSSKLLVDLANTPSKLRTWVTITLHRCPWFPECPPILYLAKVNDKESICKTIQGDDDAQDMAEEMEIATQVPPLPLEKV